MRKNAFTLIEMLAVITILGILIVLFIPNINRVLDDNSIKVYKLKEEQLVNAAKEFIYDPSFIKPTEGNPTNVTIQELSSGEYLSKIVDSRSKNECQAYVRVSVAGNDEYNYEPCIICDEYKTDASYCTMG